MADYGLEVYDENGVEIFMSNWNHYRMIDTRVLAAGDNDSFDYSSYALAYDLFTILVPLEGYCRSRHVTTISGMVVSWTYATSPVPLANIHTATQMQVFSK